MILQSLVEYYEALQKKGEAPEFGWCSARVSFALDISLKGELLRILPLKTEEPRGKKSVMIPQLMEVPFMVSRSVGICSNFLCDNSTYFLGIDNKGKPERSMQCFEAAKEKHLSILAQCHGNEAIAIKNFFTNWKPAEAEQHPALSGVFDELIAGGNIIFNVDTVYAHQIRDIAEAWNVYYNQPAGDSEGVCLVTGKHGEIARLHGTLQGVQGAQSSGAALVSFNAPAFESYGKEQSYNAPVGTYAVYAYITALSQLLTDKKHKTSLGDATIVYWSHNGEEKYQNVFAASVEPSVENYELVDGLFKNLEAGKGIDINGLEKEISMEEPFYILGLSPNAARISVRFFYRDSFGNILRNIKRHYDEMRIVRPNGDPIEYMGMWRMLQEIVNKKSKDKKAPSNIAGSVYRAIISGTRYPDALYQAVLRRIRAEQDDKDSHIYKVTKGRAAIIKAYLIRNTRIDKEEITMALNEDSNNLAYVLGRQFAVLEAIQSDSNNGINATIKDRYFNAACATPASIFPVLYKLKNSHIRKINVGRKIAYEKKLQGLQDKIEVLGDDISSYPKRLSLEEQGMFILGYYHQTQKNFEKKTEEDKKDGGSN